MDWGNVMRQTHENAASGIVGIIKGIYNNLFLSNEWEIYLMMLYGCLMMLIH